MIVGIGTDIADIARIEHLVNGFGERATRKLFTEPEISYCKAKANPAVHFAGRWAAKEAFYKALPASLQPLCTWKTFQIVAREGYGKPVLEVIDAALAAGLHAEGIDHIHHSISHELAGYCVAFVVLEKTDAR